VPDKKNRVQGLTSQQEVAINLLATGSTIQEVSEVLNVKPYLIDKWIRYIPAFRAKLKELKGDLNRKV